MTDKVALRKLASVELVDVTSQTTVGDLYNIASEKFCIAADKVSLVLLPKTKVLQSFFFPQK